jgi:excisionase family DNA binding protein
MLHLLRLSDNMEIGERNMSNTPTDCRLIPPTAEDSQLARESSRRLTHLLGARDNVPLRVRVEPDGEPGEAISIPVSAFRLLNSILMEMAKGNGVTLIPVHGELTTQQAADFLNVSRPFLIEQLEKGIIGYRKVGTHRRVLFQSLMEYKQAMDQNRLKALEELSAIDQESGLGY